MWAYSMPVIVTEAILFNNFETFNKSEFRLQDIKFDFQALQYHLYTPSP